MKFITIGGAPASGKTYTSKIIAKDHNFLALEVEPLRWDYFNDNFKKNVYKFTNNTPFLSGEGMREYYMRCALYEKRIPYNVLVEWHKDTMNYIAQQLPGIIEELKLIKNKEDYLLFCEKYKKLINYMPEFENLNKDYVICSHAFINTIEFSNDVRVKIDFVADMNLLFNRFKGREKIIDNKYDVNIEFYYQTYQEVLKQSFSHKLKTTDSDVFQKINALIKNC